MRWLDALEKSQNAMDLSYARSIARIQASHRAVVNRLHHTQDAVSELKSRVETSVPRKNTSSRTRRRNQLQSTSADAKCEEQGFSGSQP